MGAVSRASRQMQGGRAMRLTPVCLAALMLALAGCTGAEQSTEQKEQVMASLTVTSSAFEAGKQIPRKFTGEGDDISPALSWTGAPPGTKEFALICDDPDAPRPQPWVHWVIYGIPADRTSLGEASKGVGVDGANSWPREGYGGPMPPPGHGVHHYHFKVYALDAPLHLEPGATKEMLLKAMESHIIGRGELVGTYER
jgi:Raf kinase inhibitor-like YbhB/YbcL family protein